MTQACDAPRLAGVEDVAIEDSVAVLRPAEHHILIPCAVIDDAVQCVARELTDESIALLIPMNAVLRADDADAVVATLRRGGAIGQDVLEAAPVRLRQLQDLWATRARVADALEDDVVLCAATPFMQTELR